MRTDQALIACLEAAVLAARQNPDTSAYRLARSIHDMHKLGRMLHRRYEADCSYPYADTIKYRKRTTILEDHVCDAAAAARLTVGFQRDPRGWPLILAFGSTEIRVGGGA